MYAWSLRSLRLPTRLIRSSIIAIGGAPAFLCDPIGFGLQFAPVRTVIGGLGALAQLDPDTGQAIRQPNQVVEIDRLAVELADLQRLAFQSDGRGMIG